MDLDLSIAFGDYDRTRPLINGSVKIEGVLPRIVTLSPEETFFRSFRNQEFDICELSMSSSTMQVARGDFPYVGIPVFLSRAFRHTAIYVRTDRIKQPSDLVGKRIGVPEYQLTANVWARAYLEDDYGVKPSDVTWVRGGIEHPGRGEKVQLPLPDSVKIEDAPDGKTISSLLASGEIDAFMAPRPPYGVDGHPHIGRLFSDPTAVAEDYYKRTKIFPIMHIVGIRRSLVEKYQWLPSAVLKAFTEAKDRALAHLSDTSATKVTLPFVEERLEHARAVMGADFWSYGIAGNEHVLERFFHYHYHQGLSERHVSASDLFHESTFETFKV